jgi:hypothetical protein
MIIALNHTIAREKEAAGTFLRASLGLDYNRVGEADSVPPVWANAGQGTRATEPILTVTASHANLM